MMNNIDIEGTTSTPKISFSPSNGKIMITGRSIPDNVHTFFLPLLNELDEYSKNPAGVTNVSMWFEYFNTGTSKFLYDFFQRLSNLKSTVIIEWIYDKDDEDILESGQDFESLIPKVKFIFIESDED